MEKLRSVSIFITSDANDEITQILGIGGTASDTAPGEAFTGLQISSGPAVSLIFHLLEFPCEHLEALGTKCFPHFKDIVESFKGQLSTPLMYPVELGLGS